MKLLSSLRFLLECEQMKKIMMQTTITMAALTPTAMLIIVPFADDFDTLLTGTDRERRVAPISESKGSLP
jgi:hypothetical protein